MIYTSYFAMLKKLPDDIIPVAICARKPDWYNGLHILTLAPKYDFFMKYKKDNDFEDFTKSYNEQVLSNLDANTLIGELEHIVRNSFGVDKDICLVCYEKSDSSCHRNLVRKWLNDNGIKCEEYNFERSK